MDRRGSIDNADSQVLEDLCKPEALRIIDLAAVRIVDVRKAIIPRCRGEVLLEAADSTGGAIEILGVPSDAPGVEV